MATSIHNASESELIDIANQTFNAINGNLANYPGVTRQMINDVKAFTDTFSTDLTTHVVSQAQAKTANQIKTTIGNMPRASHFFVAVFCLMSFLSVFSHAQNHPTLEFVGRFTDGKDYAVYFEQTKYGLTIRPVMWTATQLLKETGKDKFTVVDRSPPDSKSLTCLRADNVSAIWKMPLSNESKPTLVADLKTGRNLNFAWSRDNQKLFVVRGTDNNDLILIKDLDRINLQ